MLDFDIYSHLNWSGSWSIHSIEIESDLENIKEFLSKYGYKYLYSKNDVNRFFSK